MVSQPPVNAIRSSGNYHPAYNDDPKQDAADFFEGTVREVNPLLRATL